MKFSVNGMEKTKFKCVLAGVFVLKAMIDVENSEEKLRSYTTYPVNILFCRKGLSIGNGVQKHYKIIQALEVDKDVVAFIPFTFGKRMLHIDKVLDTKVVKLLLTPAHKVGALDYFPAQSYLDEFFESLKTVRPRKRRSGF